MTTWHTERSKSRLHTLVNEAMDRIAEDQSDLYDGYQRNARAYLDRPITGFSPGEWTHHPSLDVLTYNVLRACVDALTSNVTLSLPLTRILPNDAKEGVQERGRNLEKLLEGVRSAERHHALERRRVRDAVLHGHGIIKVINDGQRPGLRHVHPSRIVVDDNASLDGIARTIYHFDFLSRESVEAIYGRTEAVTSAQASAGMSSITGAPSMVDRDLIRVIEAHALAPKRGAKGRRVLCTTSGVLVDEEFEGELPYSILRYTADECGWHGVGLGSILGGIQAEINRTLEAIRENVKLMAVPYWLVPAGTKVVDNDLLTNQRGRKIEYFGNVPPKIEIPPAISPQVIQYLDTLYGRAFELAGISQLSASSLKPAGLESGIALLNLRDVETQRFAEFARGYEEESGVKVPRLIVQQARAIGSSWSIKGSGKEFVRSIKWSDASLDDDMFDLQLFPQSSLPKNPAGRAEFVIRLAEQQLIERADLFALLEMPDISKTMQLATAEYNDLERTFETILDTGEYLEPIEYQDLDLGRRICLRYWSRGRIQRADDERLELLVRWMRDAREIEQAAEAMAAAQQATAPMPQHSAPQGLVPPNGGEPMPPALQPDPNQLAM